MHTLTCPYCGRYETVRMEVPKFSEFFDYHHDETEMICSTCEAERRHNDID